MDFSNITRLGISDVDPGAIIGQPSPDAFKPIPYMPLTEPLQKVDFNQIMMTTPNDEFVKTTANENKEVDKNISKESKEPKKINYKKLLGISSLVLLALFGGAKLINLVKKAVKKP